MALEDITRRGVLVADHAPHMAALVAIMLRSLGCRDISEVFDAPRALSELNRRPFDLLIIDDAPNGMDGVAFTKKLRAASDCQNRHIPIIMMSAAPDAKRITDARDAGVTEFLRKPFAANHLQSRLANIEAHPRGFIEADHYTGPDRRRKTLDIGDHERREPKADEPE